MCTVQAAAVQECIITRVGVNPVNGKFAWKVGDTIAVSPSAPGKFKPFALTSGAEDSFGEFTGKLAPSAVKGCAVYPWSARPAYEDGRLRLSIPRETLWDADTLRLPMFAPAEDYAAWNIFYFKPLAGIAHINIPSLEAQTASILLSAGTAAVSGRFDVDDSTCPAMITPRGVTDGSADTTAIVRIPAGNASEVKTVDFVLPQGEYPELKLFALGEAGDTLQSFHTSPVSVQRGGITWTDAFITGGDGPYYQKVSAAKSSWVGEYLLVCAREETAWVMYTDSHFADLNTPAFQVELTPQGIPASEALNAGLLRIRTHKADDSGTGPSKDQGGKYTMFLPDGRGIGRFARTTFGFNNNASAGRFVETFSYDAAAGCIRISCATKNQGESYLRFNTSSHVFGMGISSEISGSEYVDVQLYEYK